MKSLVKSLGTLDPFLSFSLSATHSFPFSLLTLDPFLSSHSRRSPPPCSLSESLRVTTFILRFHFWFLSARIPQPRRCCVLKIQSSARDGTVRDGVLKLASPALSSPPPPALTVGSLPLVSLNATATPLPSI